MKLCERVQRASELALVVELARQRQRLMQMRASGSLIAGPETRRPQWLKRHRDSSLVSELSRDRETFLEVSARLLVAAHPAAELAGVEESSAPAGRSALRALTRERFDGHAMPKF